MAGKEQDYGETARTVAANISRIRAVRGMTYTRLSDQLGVLGLSISPVGVRRIEDCQRRVTVDDLVIIAMALLVSPATLLMPARNDDGSEVEAKDLVPISGWTKRITASVVWEWLKADRPLVHGTFASFAQNAWPAWERQEFDTQIAREALKKRDQRRADGDG